MQAGKINVITLQGKSNADSPVQIQETVHTIFCVDENDFGLYTVGPVTGRQYFGKIMRGKWSAYEVLGPDGQKSVILQRMY